MDPKNPEVPDIRELLRNYRPPRSYSEIDSVGAKNLEPRYAPYVSWSPAIIGHPTRMPGRPAQLLLFIGAAIASGILGNAAFELMRSVIQKIVTSTAKTPYFEWKIGEVVTEDEAGKFACHTLALYRKSLGFDEDEYTYSITSIRLKNHGWDAEISLSDRDAMPYQIRIGIKPNKQGPDALVAELW